MFSGHHGPITGSLSVFSFLFLKLFFIYFLKQEFQLIPQMVPVIFGILLSSSMDWSVRLWSHKKNICLATFEDYGDYVSDVQW